MAVRKSNCLVGACQWLRSEYGVRPCLYNVHIKGGLGGHWPSDVWQRALCFKAITRSPEQKGKQFCLSATFCLLIVQLNLEILYKKFVCIFCLLFSPYILDFVWTLFFSFAVVILFFKLLLYFKRRNKIRLIL